MGRGVAGAGHLRVRPRGRARRAARGGLLDRHPAAHGVRLAAHGSRVQLHAHRLHRALQADGRASTSSTRSAGTTTACPPRSASRTTTACAATRRCTTTPTSSRRSAGDARSTKAADELPISRQNFIELCDELTVKDEEAFESLFRRIGHSYDWSITYRTIDDHSRATAQQAFLRNLARGEAYQAEAPGLWDVTFQTAVAQAELEARDYPGALPPRRLPRTPAARCTSRRRAPSSSRAVVALIAHPDDERYQPLFGTHGAHRRCSASRCRCSRTRPPRWTRAPASPCAAPSATSPTSCGGASCACRPAPSSPAPGASSARCPSGSSATPGERLLRRRAGRQDGIRRPRGRRGRRCARAATSRASRPRPSARPTSTSAARSRSRSSPRASGTSATAAATPTSTPTLVARGEEIDFHPPFMRSRYANWVERPQRRLARLAPALLRRADPGLVPRRRRR